MMNNKGTLMRIIQVNSLSDIVVEFQDKYNFRKRTTYSNFKRGQVKNPYDITVYGVGAVGEGKYKTWERGHITTAYSIWADMLRRCYSEKIKDKQLAYFGIVTVCDKWKIYQNFAEWYEKNKYFVNERLHLDKDILYPGNTIYSPKTCLLVPQKINEQFHYTPKDNGIPTGVSLTNTGTYSATCNGKYLGTYQTLEKAYEIYSAEKERVVKEMADDYIGIIPNKVYTALYDYKFLLENDKNYRRTA